MKSIAVCLSKVIRKTNAPRIAPVVFGLLAWAAIAFAQSGAGSIQGTVTDPTGAVIPGARVHVVNKATGVAMDSKTNNVGFYQVPGLNTGTYAVSITAPNMKTYNQHGRGAGGSEPLRRCLADHRFGYAASHSLGKHRPTGNH